MEAFFQRRRIRRFIELKIHEERAGIFSADPELDIERQLFGKDSLATPPSSPPRTSTSELLHPSSNKEPLSFSERLVRRISGITPTKSRVPPEPPILNAETLELEEKDTSTTKFLVQLGGETDECNPKNWSVGKRVLTTGIIFSMVFVCGWGSSANSVSNGVAAKEFGVTVEVESWATALFLFGNAMGALVSGPISETVGRNYTYFVSMAAYLMCMLGVSLAREIELHFAFRFLAGLMASPVLTNYGGSLADLWTPEERSAVWPVFALSPILGPVLTPVGSGWFIQFPQTFDWRWVDWLALFMGTASFLLAILLLPETFSPTLLHNKASILRHLTDNPRFLSPTESQAPLIHRLRDNLSRPFVFFTSEPIVILLGAYLSVLYILVFTFLDGFTFIFVDMYGFKPGLRGTTFTSIAIGVLINTATAPIFRRKYLNYVASQKRAAHLAAKKSSTPEEEVEVTIDPEIRLWPAIIAAPLLPISLFWMGWTSSPTDSFWIPLAAAVVFGYSLMGIFTASYQYILDSYNIYSASALSSITFMRYVIAGGMVLAGMPMYRNLGVKWTLTLWAVVGLVLVPVPFVFWKYGTSIRARSRFARRVC